jgi:cell division protein FtsB
MKSGSLSRPSLAGGRRGSALIVLALVALGALAMAGPYGLLAWGEAKTVLQQREARIAKLEEERAELANLVDRLDPQATDPDLVTELIRRDLNVAHPDEYVMEVTPPAQ